jgi:hypothetical protein
MEKEYRLGIRLVATVVLAACFILRPTRVRAADIDVVENSVDYNFAQQATFTLRAETDVEITRLYLFFRAQDDDDTEVVEIDLEEPTSEVDVSYVYDLRHSPLPSFAEVTFWWRLEDGADTALRTAPRQFHYIDNRFQWEQLAVDGITAHWIEGRGDLAFGQAALDIAQSSVMEIGADLRLTSTDPIDIYIYDTQQNLRAAMVLTGRDWVARQARPELGVIVVAVPDQAGYTSKMKRYLPHEITHLLVYRRVTPLGYQHVPAWLDEGLATDNERLPTPEYELMLERAREQGQLLSLKDLCVPFSPDAGTALLSYAQSASVVRFIRERYGSDGIRSLLAAYADGASCEGGVRVALNTSLDGLERAWEASLVESPWQVWVDRVGVWIGLWVLISVPPMVLVIGQLRRS